ncbi:MAG: hypothetical protein WC996_08055 [Peptostreptococcales bacterium]
MKNEGRNAKFFSKELQLSSFKEVDIATCSEISRKTLMSSGSIYSFDKTGVYFKTYNRTDLTLNCSDSSSLNTIKVFNTVDNRAFSFKLTDFKYDKDNGVLLIDNKEIFILGDISLSPITRYYAIPKIGAPFIISNIANTSKFPKPIRETYMPEKD